MRLKAVILMILLTVPVALFASAQKEQTQNKTVVLYTAHEQDVIDEMVPAFEADTGIKIQYVKAGSGDIIQRVKAEAANPQGDVIWSIGGEQLEAMPELLAPYTPKDWDKIEPVFKVGTNWLPYTGIVMVFVVNTNLVPANLMPQKWTDLADPRLKGKISSARADKSGSSYMQLATVLNIYKDKGWDVYKSILQNFVLSGSSGAVSRFVNDGEAAVGLTLEDNAFRFFANGGPVKIIYPQDGTTAAPDGIALIKGAPHPDTAKAFIDWALSKRAQDILVKKMARRPVRIDGAVPAGLPPLSQIKTVPYSFKWSADNRDEFLKKWTDLVMQVGI
ncbi:MAG TPA: extracellular solute-binding protein [Spirochaetia bacterium]|nr:extracellular solute-binding protein [Spirochaetia bacterium]